MGTACGAPGTPGLCLAQPSALRPNFGLFEGFAPFERVVVVFLLFACSSFLAGILQLPGASRRPGVAEDRKLSINSVWVPGGQEQEHQSARAGGVGGGGKAAISRLPAIEEAAVPRLSPGPSPPALPRTVEDLSLRAPDHSGEATGRRRCPGSGSWRGSGQVQEVPGPLLLREGGQPRGSRTPGGGRGRAAARAEALAAQPYAAAAARGGLPEPAGPLPRGGEATAELLRPPQSTKPCEAPRSLALARSLEHGAAPGRAAGARRVAGARGCRRGRGGRAPAAGPAGRAAPARGPSRARRRRGRAGGQRAHAGGGGVGGGVLRAARRPRRRRRRRGAGGRRR